MNAHVHSSFFGSVLRALFGQKASKANSPKPVALHVTMRQELLKKQLGAVSRLGPRPLNFGR